jgi:hypothetical protein
MRATAQDPIQIGGAKIGYLLFTISGVEHAQARQGELVVNFKDILGHQYEFRRPYAVHKPPPDEYRFVPGLQR